MNFGLNYEFLFLHFLTRENSNLTVLFIDINSHTCVSNVFRQAECLLDRNIVQNEIEKNIKDLILSDKILLHYVNEKYTF